MDAYKTIVTLYSPLLMEYGPVLHCITYIMKITNLEHKVQLWTHKRHPNAHPQICGKHFRENMHK